MTAAGLRERQVEQAGCGRPDAPTSGLVGYLGDEPVGWCAVEPRADYRGLVRVFRVPWEGRPEEDRDDPTVWAITCLFTRAGYRRRGVSRAMAAAAVELARAGGAAAVEGYPYTQASLAEECHVGTFDTFRAAGLEVVHQATLRRMVMRLDFAGDGAGD